MSPKCEHGSYNSIGLVVMYLGKMVVPVQALSCYVQKCLSIKDRYGQVVYGHMYRGCVVYVE